ncbi:MAG: cysteine hydrolase [Desulfatitalea sp.]|nr:cysteine hydrolase [Desulfatitalea sp.]
MRTQVLIIVDMLNDFIRPEGALYCGERAQAIVPFIGERLAAARAAGHPVIYLQDAHAPDDKEFDRFPPHCVAGTWGSRIIDELAPRAGEPVLTKTRYSGFYGTSLDTILAEIKPEAVEVVGVCTSICVMDTVGGLANRDYPVRVPSQGVADFDEAFHRFALERMQRLYGANVA